MGKPSSPVIANLCQMQICAKTTQPSPEQRGRGFLALVDPLVVAGGVGQRLPQAGEGEQYPVPRLQAAVGAGLPQAGGVHHSMLPGLQSTGGEFG